MSARDAGITTAADTTPITARATHQPPTTSLGQCTPRTKREIPIATPMTVNGTAISADHEGSRTRLASATPHAHHTAMPAVACPDGNAGSVRVSNGSGQVGRTRPTRGLRKWVISGAIAVTSATASAVRRLRAMSSTISVTMARTVDQ